MLSRATPALLEQRYWQNVTALRVADRAIVTGERGQRDTGKGLAMDKRDCRWDERIATPAAGVSAAGIAPDLEYVPSAGTSLSAILSKLVADAAQALDHDHEVARTLLRRAATLLQPSAAPRGLTARAAALPLSELANVTQLSNSYFSRAFKGTFGQPPHAFIMCRRVKRAQQEMLEGLEPLSQIALSCGFADQAHLARIFRREMGFAPSAWRRAHRPAADPLDGGASVTN